MLQPPKLERVHDPTAVRMLFLAPYAPDGPDYAVKPYHGDGGYPQYHFSLYRALKNIGFSVSSSSKPYAIQFARGNVDFVFSLMNRMPILNAEIFISSYCEFARLPYLGARPNIRALAEDKYLTKLAARSLGIPVPNGVHYHRGCPPPNQAPFAGPYFVKHRFGAASEGITEKSACADWEAVREEFGKLAEADDVLVEEFCSGVDVTVSVLGGENPQVLGFVQPLSDKPGGILTEDLKLHDHLGYRIIDVGPMEGLFLEDARAMWTAFGPIDYYRADYRVDVANGKRSLLEFNICCYLGRKGAICLSAAQYGLTQADVLHHIVAYSLKRQQFLRQKCEWIL